MRGPHVHEHKIRRLKSRSEFLQPEYIFSPSSSLSTPDFGLRVCSLLCDCVSVRDCPSVTVCLSVCLLCDLLDLGYDVLLEKHHCHVSIMQSVLNNLLRARGRGEPLSIIQLARVPLRDTRARAWLGRPGAPLLPRTRRLGR